jgi:dnd system-associated protein 4
MRSFHKRRSCHLASREAHRDILIERGDKYKLFRRLLEERLSPFYSWPGRELFMYAVGLGFANKARKQLKSRRAIFQRSTLSSKDEAMIKAIAIAETKAVDVMRPKNLHSAYEIAEEYANGGLTHLEMLVFGSEPGSPEKRMEQDLRDTIARKKKLT